MNARRIIGVTECIEHLTRKAFPTEVMQSRLYDFIAGGYDQIVYASHETFYFSKTVNMKSLYEIDGFRIWAHSEEEAKTLKSIIDKF